MDPDAFAALYEKEAEAVLVFHVRRTFDAEFAVEMTAETFAQAWLARGSLRATSELERRAWLFTIARRTLWRSLRRSRLERKAVARLGVRLPQVHEDDLAAIEERASLGPLREAVGTELEQLSADHREALRLRIVEERDYPEIAGELGVSEATARARVSRGLRALGRRLEERAGALEAGS